MEGVEDIPGSALAEGITWQWESFPEYLDAVEKRPLAVDYGTQIAHGAVRGYAMGDRGARNEEATDEDIAAMARIVQEAIEAGALGFSTSRTEGHRAIDGEAVPGTYAAEQELFGLGRAMAAGGRAVFEVAPQGVAGESPAEASIRELEWMTKLAAEIERPVSFAMIQTPGAPDLWREMLDRAGKALENGIDCDGRAPADAGANGGTDAGAGAGIDAGAPVLSNIAASSITTTSAVVSWTVDQPATGQVNYGTSVAYGSATSPETSFIYRQHAQSVSGLTRDDLPLSRGLEECGGGSDRLGRLHVHHAWLWGRLTDRHNEHRRGVEPCNLKPHLEHVDFDLDGPG